MSCAHAEESCDVPWDGGVAVAQQLSGGQMSVSSFFSMVPFLEKLLLKTLSLQTDFHSNKWLNKIGSQLVDAQCPRKSPDLGDR